MKNVGTLGVTVTIACIFILSFVVSYAAYNHKGDVDSVNFRTSYPEKVGFKLDSCTLCHAAGMNRVVQYGSCHYCHAVSNYGKTAGFDYSHTLNPFGLAYLKSGRNSTAIKAIENFDSDKDGYSNKEEIYAGRYPGDPKDNPTKVLAPSTVLTRNQIEKMPQHTQFFLMNSIKSTDTYAQYSGVPMEDLIRQLVLQSATGVTVFSPDGYSQYYPLHPTRDLYHLYGSYPVAQFYYNPAADTGNNTVEGWCDYSAPSAQGRQNGDKIFNSNGLKVILATKRDGNHLTSGTLTPSNKLRGEGPFRVLPPQKAPGPPDQKDPKTGANQNVVWPFDETADHNAGFSTRSVTMIKVEPLPEGTTDIDTVEAGWPYIDQEKIVIYGAINPVPSVLEKLVQLNEAIYNAPKSAFKKSCANKVALKLKVDVVWWLVKKGHYCEALKKLDNDIVQKMNGCSQPPGTADKNDLVKDCEIQKQLYWLAHEIMVLLKIVA